MKRFVIFDRIIRDDDSIRIWDPIHFLKVPVCFNKFCQTRTELTCTVFVCKCFNTLPLKVRWITLILSWSGSRSFRNPHLNELFKCLPSTGLGTASPFCELLCRNGIGSTDEDVVDTLKRRPIRIPLF
ncbi:hypothetical protein C496_19960 [Natronorubrum tibetense GA33]|uniref:Uncharacterized protein n=1 Tax=Natronorubrum tibetense GA33 TaxID=1114856 RepID=L9VLG2_9EURY|nr:hypothetical protein C496_19960 [Natronorubrum tibetense GA33]